MRWRKVCCKARPRVDRNERAKVVHRVVAADEGVSYLAESQPGTAGSAARSEAWKGNRGEGAELVSGKGRNDRSEICRYTMDP